MSIFGTAIIAWNGRELQSVEGSVSFNPGLAIGKARKGPRGFVGSTIVPGMSALKCDVLITDDFDVTEMAGGAEATVRVFDEQSNQEWIVPRMILSADPTLADGSESKWSLEFEGSTAERV